MKNLEHSSDTITDVDKVSYFMISILNIHTQCLL